MPSPLEKLPPLESQEFQNPHSVRVWFPLDRISQARPTSLTREKLGTCGTIAAAGPLDNPVLTLNTAADNSRENGGSVFHRIPEELLDNSSSVADLFVLDSGITLTPNP